MQIRALLAAAALAAAMPVFATPQARNATDLWFNAGESGWGVNLIHQGDTIFASLFVYGPDGRPQWYFASSLVGDGSTYSGKLFRTTGPSFGGPFNPASVQVHDVGTMALALGDGVAGLDYTIDGVHVTKAITRYTFRRTTLAGRYEGAMLQPAGGGAPESGKTDLTFIVNQDGSAIVMDTSSDSQSPCTWMGTTDQDGQYETAGGVFECAGGSRRGTWSMRVDPATEGFTGTFSGDGVTGRVAAAASQSRMQGAGWRNDLWFAPGEPGWGLNVIEQGDTIFASLFVYDTQGRPRWYSASNLRQQGDSADGDVTYAGPLTESTGPSFGASFDSTAVTRRTVGQMTFRARPDGQASLSYSVDGVQVSKPLQRYTFRKNDFSGSYIGAWAHDRQATFTIDDSGSDFRMQMVDRFGGKGTCDFVAPLSQSGSLRTMSGTFTCTGGQAGAFTMRDATVSANGFVARLEAPALDPFLGSTHIGGARR